ncbi:insulinase family protein [uncultured Paraglaciecola sp.]|uniref:insulinase family protein n=1 Tax=uncultured Paraglaciecola sp. TaxID=1765024 RepID=UPI00260FD005|nr:insulinase family protein [uncultured Paraglaciecola sp.]
MNSSFGHYISLALTVCACFLFFACSSSGKFNAISSSVQTNQHIEIIKSPSDSRQYASIVLENQLELVLVSDPSKEKSTIALSVAAGSFQEPKEFAGLAHYLEHMLLLGTKRFPKAGAYNEFAILNGGFQNAYTQLNHTNYMLTVNNAAFDEGLSRFSDLFYQALFDETYADKERQSVHSEWSMQGLNDGVILEQLNGSTLNPAHPVSRFSWGNLDTLVDKQDNKLHRALVAMYQHYYSANLMKATMISNLPLDEMKILAKQHFAKIPNRHTSKPQISAPVATAEQLNKVIHYVPQANMKQLRLSFVIDTNTEQFAVKPNAYISYLLDNEMPGTLAAVLRDAGLSEAVYSGFDADQYGNAGSFTLYIDLTERGRQNRDKVMAATLKYLALLRDQGVNAQYFSEIKQSLSNSFRFKEKTKDFEYAVQIATNLHYTPVEFVLSCAYQYQNFDPDAIHDVLAQLTLSNARVFYIDKKQPFDSKMQYFEGQYKLNDITPSMRQTWQDLSAQFTLNLPNENRLMPQRFNIIEPVYTQKPELLVNEKGFNVHLGHSALFKQPKGIIILELNSKLPKASAKHQIIAELLGRAIGQQFIELQTEANVAGMSLNLSISNGLVLTISGFTDKQQELLAAAYKLIENFTIDDNELNSLKLSLRSSIKDRARQDLSSQLWQKLNQVIYLDEYSAPALLEEIASTTAEQVMQFRQQLLEQNNLRVLAFGNYSAEQAKDLAGLVKGSASNAYPAADLYHSAIIPAAPQQFYIWQQDSKMHDVGLIDAYLVPSTWEDLGTARLLSKLIHPALLTQIRTDEQLAYNVSFGGETLEHHMLLAFEIQSPAKDLSEIHKRIALFRKEFAQKLTLITAKEFASLKQGILVSLMQKPSNLSEEVVNFIEDWGYQRWSFTSKQELIAAIEKSTLQDVINLYQRLQSNGHFTRVLIQMRGTKFADKAFIEPKGAIKITDVDNFH